MILIVGASSTIGRAVILLLREAGYQLRLSSRDPGKLQEFEGPGIEIIHADLLDSASIERACQGVEKVLLTSHSIIGRGKNASRFVDLEGSQMLIDVARKNSVAHFVYISALEARADHSNEFFRHKAQIEAYLKQSGLSYTILRPSAFFVPHTILHSQAFADPQTALGEFLTGKKATFFGRGETIHNFVANEDVARFAFIALTDPKAVNRSIDVGGADNLTARQVADIYSRVTGIPKRISSVPLFIPFIMHIVLKPFHPGMSGAMQFIVLNENNPTPYDMTTTAEQFSMRLTRLEDWVHAKMQR